jgi:hypothetical protein
VAAPHRVRRQHPRVAQFCATVNFVAAAIIAIAVAVGSHFSW